jgi:hypothetical protein
MSIERRFVGLLRVTCGIISPIKTVAYDQMGAIEDDFWTERLQLFTAQFPTYYTTPQKVWGKFHACDERYFDGSHEIIPPVISPRAPARGSSHWL